jgi:ABC-type arginine transport system permease subunit
MQNATWLTIGISAASIIVGTVTALSIAAMQRKQMRQIELHRQDPSVSLVPPPHAVTLFLKRWGVPLVNSSINISLLIREMIRTGPVTREQVFTIAFVTGALVIILIGEAFLWLTRSTIELISDLTRVIDEALDMIHHTFDRQWTIIEVLSKARLPERKPEDDEAKTS